MSLAVLADHMASKGRNGDTMLVHMTPEEVRGLHALAVAHGGELTINPETGLPEANFLKSFLPTIIGAGISIASGGTIDPMTAALIVGGGETVRTGDIKKGIAAGFGAYSGASFGAGLSAAGEAGLQATAGQEAARVAAEQLALPNTLGQEEAVKYIQQQVAEKAAALSPYEKLMAGAKGIMEPGAGRDAFMSAMGGTKGLMRTGLGLAAPLLAAEDVKAKMPQTVTPTSMITPYAILGGQGGDYSMTGLGSYKPEDFIRLGGFQGLRERIARGELTPPPPPGAAGGGLMGMASGGVAFESGTTPSYQRTSMSPGMLDFAQRSEPVVRMADGGTPPPLATREQVLAAYKANPLAELNPNDEAIKHWMTSGLGNFNQVVQDVRAANPMLAKQIDAARAVAQPNPLNLSTAGYNYSAEPVDVSKAAIISGTAPAGYSYADAAITNPQEQQINQLYRNILNRDVEQEGLNYWMGQAQKGLSMPEIEAQIRQISRDIGVAAPTKAAPPTVTAVDTTYGGDTTTPTYTAPKPQVTLGEAFKPTAPTMGEVKTAYEQGGGSTRMPTIADIKPTDRTYTYNEAFGLLKGYLQTNPNAQYQDVVSFARSKGIPEMQAKAAYNEFRFSSLTGASQRAYDYLMGRAPYQAGRPEGSPPISRSYAEAMGITGGYQNLKPISFTKDQSAVASGVPKEVPTVKDPSGNRYSDFVSFYFDANPDVQKAYETDPEAKKMLPEDYVQFHYREFGSKPTEKRKGYYDQLVAKAAEAAAPGGASGGLGSMIRMGTLGGGAAEGGHLGSYSDGGRLLRGPGDGVSDSIPAVIGNKRPARLADGEFVVPARIVSELGNGSTEAGARKLYAMMDRVQAARRKSIGKGKVAKNSRADKYLPA